MLNTTGWLPLKMGRLLRDFYEENFQRTSVRILLGAGWILVLFVGFCNGSACGLCWLRQFSGWEHGSVRRGTECLSDAIIRLDAEGNSDKGRCVFVSRLKREQLSRNTKTANTFFENAGKLQILGIQRHIGIAFKKKIRTSQNSGNFLFLGLSAWCLKTTVIQGTTPNKSVPKRKRNGISLAHLAINTERGVFCCVFVCRALCVN